MGRGRRTRLYRQEESVHLPPIKAMFGRPAAQDLELASRAKVYFVVRSGRRTSGRTAHLRLVFNTIVVTSRPRSTSSRVCRGCFVAHIHMWSRQAAVILARRRSGHPLDGGKLGLRPRSCGSPHLHISIRREIKVCKCGNRRAWRPASTVESTDCGTRASLDIGSSGTKKFGVKHSNERRRE